VFCLIALHNFNNFTEFWNFGKEKQEGFLLFSQQRPAYLSRKLWKKKRQTQLELPVKTMNSTSMTLHTDHLKAGFAQEEIFFFRTGFSCA
jgi:hypothetical protein